MTGRSFSAQVRRAAQAAERNGFMLPRAVALPDRAFWLCPRIT
jgi:hypothetical protein